MRRALSDDEIRGRLADLTGWTYTDGALRREFAFADFAQAFGFMASIAVIAQGMDHHPDWRNVYNKVEIALSTHDVGGISERDFELARKINEIV